MDLNSSKKQISFLSWKNISLIFLLAIIWLKTFDVISVKIIQKWHKFFSYYDGYRLPASISAFLPFTLETLSQDTADTVIVFTGDSTSGGLLYHHSQAIPAYLNQAISKRAGAVHTYNLPFSGAHLSEQYLLIQETLNYADVVIFPIHYSFFSGRGENGNFISHPEILDYLTTASQSDVSGLGLKPTPLFEAKTRNLLGQFWYTFKVHRLLPQVVLGKPAKFWINSKIRTFLALKPSSENQAIVIDSNLPFTQQTSAAQDEILKQNLLLWEKLDRLTPDNPNLLYLKKIGELSRSSGKQFIAYFIPLDLDALTSNQILEPEVYDQIIAGSKQVLDDYEIPYIDFNADNPASLTTDDFYNPDHLLPRGNQKVAGILAQKVLDDL